MGLVEKAVRRATPKPIREAKAVVRHPVGRRERADSALHPKGETHRLAVPFPPDSAGEELVCSMLRGAGVIELRDTGEHLYGVARLGPCMAGADFSPARA
jgi:hypothetical protein